jgi:hypothetical protein
MAHIHYRISTPETKAVVAFGERDQKLVAKIERMLTVFIHTDGVATATYDKKSLGT